MSPATNLAPPAVPLSKDAVEPAPTWARRAAHAAAFTALPSGLWRVALELGMPVGFSPRAARELFDVPGAGAAYLVGLSLLLGVLALLTLGLVQRWGAEVPAWMPLAGGRRPNPTAVMIAAAAGPSP